MILLHAQPMYSDECGLLHAHWLNIRMLSGTWDLCIDCPLHIIPACRCNGQFELVVEKKYTGYGYTQRVGHLMGISGDNIAYVTQA